MIGAALGGGSVVRLLAPELRRVPYRRRRSELAALLRWCRERPAVQVRLVTGPGGVGKTRLAVEASRRLTRTGWHCVWIRPGIDPARVLPDVARRNTLVVVDDAMARTDLVRVLDALRAPAHGKLRVLLMSRVAGDWWSRLRWASGLVAAADSRVSDQHLEPLGHDDAVSLVRPAVRAFSSALGVGGAGVVAVPPDHGALPLDLHATALAAVLESADRWPEPCDGDPVPADPDVAVGMLLDSERVRWLREAPIPGIDPAGMDDAVAVGVMLGTTSGTTVVHVLNRVLPARADVTRLGPGPGPVGLVVGLPHRLIEQHVARQIATAPWLVVEWLRELAPDVAHRVALIMTGLLAVPPPGFAPEDAERVLDRVVDEMPADGEALLGVLHLLVQQPELPAGQVRTITARMLGLDPAGTLRAEVLTYRTRALRALGRPDEAAAAGQEAVALWRAAHAADPGRYETVLADAIALLGQPGTGAGA
ncbi:hypothetical protein GCM10009751_30560 [Myceligenerans crystallogenes]|uniref:Novel STAND NTPase 5 domain-containing protein n=2 Tax=Myceligenerans crystallogenes TaxID=316335 RepID=A0ABP4ZUH2_9MICO